MGDRRCCCVGGTCFIFSDDFCEEASTTLTSDWAEVSGDWEYDGDCGLVTDDSGAAVLTTAQSKTVEQFVVGSPHTISVGDKYRVVANAVDADNYLFAELEQEAAQFTVRLYSRTSGSNSLLREESFTPQLNPENGIGIGICLSRYVFSVRIENQDVTAANGNVVYTCSHDIHTGGKKAGLGNGNSSEVIFDGFAFGDLIGDGAGAVAGQCRENQCCEFPCTCCENGKEVCIPPTLLMTIEAGGGCEAFDGLTIYLYYNAGADCWVSEPSQPACFDGVRWVFTCRLEACLPEYDIGTFGLYMADVGITGCYQEFCLHNSIGWWEESYICDPFEVVYGATSYDPREIAGPCACCDSDVAGWMKFTITEA